MESSRSGSSWHPHRSPCWPSDVPKAHPDCREDNPGCPGKPTAARRADGIQPPPGMQRRPGKCPAYPPRAGAAGEGLVWGRKDDGALVCSKTTTPKKITKAHAEMAGVGCPEGQRLALDVRTIASVEDHFGLLCVKGWPGVRSPAEWAQERSSGEESRAKCGVAHEQCSGWYRRPAGSGSLFAEMQERFHGPFVLFKAQSQHMYSS